jgi:hypothetical protein
MKSKKIFYCKEYPTYVFNALDYAQSQFRITVMRGVDSMLIVDLIVGERLTLFPVLRVSKNESNKRKRLSNAESLTQEELILKEDCYILCQIMTIDQSANGRRSDVVVQAL